MAVSCVDFSIQSFILVLMMVYFKIIPSAMIVWLPVFIFILVMTSFGVSLLLGSLNIVYRDVNTALPLLMQAWFFLSPVVYSERMIPEKWQFLYAMNPMSEVVRGFRSALLHTQYEIGMKFYIAISVSLILFISGMVIFQRLESSLVDYMAN